MYINHPHIKPESLEQRAYQTNIAEAATQGSTLVVLPTGMGKTIIALLVIANLLQQTEKKILFLSPTKPLVNQHASFLKTYLTTDAPLTVFTGETPPAKRKQLWDQSHIIVSTPQVIENDLIARQISLENTGLIIFDEVHRAVGNYSYVYIAQLYKKQNPTRLTLGMTASPGNDVNKILEVCKHLEIKNIEIRTKQDRDVRPYVHDLTIQWKEIGLPNDFATSIQLLRKALAQRLKKLKEIGVLDSAALSLINRTKLLELQRHIQQKIRASPTPSKQLYTAASLQNACLKLYHAVELLQTQGVNAVKNYFQRLGTEAQSKSGSKASRDIMRDLNVLDALAHINTLTIEHPKIPETTAIINRQLTQNNQSKIILFTHYRDTSQYLYDHLIQHPLIKPARFIGQAGKGKDKGLTQKEQIKIINDFKQGTYNVLIATSVAEEGLDLPSTNLVIFYEPVPSEIRTIQRRGRTARKMPGKVVILITKGTPDEGYYWSAKRKEKNMRSELELLRSKLQKNINSIDTYYQKCHKNQKKLEDYPTGSTPIIITDTREYRSTVVRHLATKHTTIEKQQLDVGDYILSQRIGVERKEVDDFLQSLIDGKLFTQVRNLRNAYARPLLIIEGEQLLTKRNISHTAIFGSIASIIVDYGIPIITTKTSQETADFLYILARREQRKGEKIVAVRGEKPTRSLREQQQFIIEGLPNISAVLAHRLLHHFGSIKAIMNASVQDLCEVHGIGKTTAQEIIQLLHADYKP